MTDTVNEARLTNAMNHLAHHLKQQAPGTEIRHRDITLLLASNGLVLSQSGMTELCKRAQANGLLTRVTQQRMITPLLEQVTSPLSDRQRIESLELQVKSLTTQVAAISNRLI